MEYRLVGGRHKTDVMIDMGGGRKGGNMIENEEREGSGVGMGSAALAQGQDLTGGFHIWIMEAEFLLMGGLLVLVQISY